MSIKIALLGCGFIGTQIARAISKKEVDAELIIAYDKERERAEKIAKLFSKKKPEIARSMDELVNSGAELIFEAASINAAKEIALKALQNNKSIALMSIGALADESFKRKVEKEAKKRSLNIYLPSGAIGGLDAISSASLAEINSIELITTKPAKALGIEADKRKKVFEGSAKEAIELFPQNINVSITLSIAGIGAERTKVKIYADPKIDRNIHEIKANGDFGKIYLKFENIPAKENPKTSYLAALSAVALLKKIVRPVKIL